MKKLEDIIIQFSKRNAQYINNAKDIKEIEIIGLFDAYIRAAKGLSIQREPKFHVNGMDLRPDFLIEVDDHPIILEFKRQKLKSMQDSNAINQVLAYMQATMSKYGIIYYSIFESNNPEIKIEMPWLLDTNTCIYIIKQTGFSLRHSRLFILISFPKNHRIFNPPLFFYSL